MSGSPVVLYDTTLRDGSQQEGISLTVGDKCKIAARLDELGVHYVEGGWPGSNPKDREFFARARKMEFANASISGFGSTRRPGVKAEEDRGLSELIASGVGTGCIVGKAWGMHVREALRVSRDENLAMVRESVEFLRAKGLKVFFDAEHFFDGYRADSGFALAVARAAADAGAEAVILCDTNGGTLPGEVARVTAALVEALACAVGVHFHNDAGCAVANSLLAVEAGATHVQGTANGIGERCGNADLFAVIAGMKLKLGIDCVSDDQLASLTAASHGIAEILNMTPNPHQPYVGTSAFAHKAGLHGSAQFKKPGAYEHVSPERVGNANRTLVSELAGRSTLVLKGRELGIDLESHPETLSALVSRVKDLEHAGYHFEAADASFEVLVRKATGMKREFFTLESYRVMVDRRADGVVTSEATIKLHARGERIVATGEGNGPVNALDQALRLALARIYPELASFELVDYKVRILEEVKGTRAVTRVLIETSDGVTEWDTIGVHENIIEASWEAMVDSVTYGLLRSEASGSEPAPRA